MLIYYLPAYMCIGYFDYRPIVGPKVHYKLCSPYFTMAVTISHPLSTPFVQCVCRDNRHSEGSIPI